MRECFEKELGDHGGVYSWQLLLTYFLRILARLFILFFLGIISWKGVLYFSGGGGVCFSDGVG